MPAVFVKLEMCVELLLTQVLVLHQREFSLFDAFASLVAEASTPRLKAQTIIDCKKLASEHRNSQISQLEASHKSNVTTYNVALIPVLVKHGIALS